MVKIVLNHKIFDCRNLELQYMVSKRCFISINNMEPGFHVKADLDYGHI